MSTGYATSVGSTSGRSTGRWIALDAFRGIAVIGMLLVNNPGDHDAVFAPLRHSAWNGCTFADLVFPFFLFVVGVTTAISEGRERDDAVAHIWRRAGVIFALGLLLNWFPFYQSGNIAWAEHPNFFDRVVERLLLLRIPGVLQRIALAYLSTALIARRASSRTIAIVVALLLVGYWLLLSIAPIDQPAQTITAQLDRALFDWSRWGLGNHLWDSALTWDPEGALSTLPAIGTTLLGLLCGRWMLRTDEPRRTRAVLIAGIVGIVAGWCWGLVFPINKALWTISYVLFTAGIAAVLLAALSVVLDGRGSSPWWARPLLIFGANPLVAYVGSELARRILHSSIKIPTTAGRLGTDEWTVRQLERIGFTTNAASLAWALLFLAAWAFALSRLSRRRLFVRA